jgi:hypothetical protein
MLTLSKVRTMAQALGATKCLRPSHTHRKCGIMVSSLLYRHFLKDFIGLAEWLK